MEDWVARALKRWPNVPALYGWLKLDRRGRWLIKGETFSRSQIVDVINRNYAVDERGCWYFQNGPQRGYMQLERAPFIVHVESGGSLLTHSHLAVQKVSGIYLDENGGLYLQTEHGPAALLDADLEWALERLTVNADLAGEHHIAAALGLPTGSKTNLQLRLNSGPLPIYRLDASQAPALLKFVLEPQLTTT